MVAFTWCVCPLDPRQDPILCIVVLYCGSVLSAVPAQHVFPSWEKLDVLVQVPAGCACGSDSSYEAACSARGNFTVENSERVTTGTCWHRSFAPATAASELGGGEVLRGLRKFVFRCYVSSQNSPLCVRVGFILASLISPQPRWRGGGWFSSAAV